MPTLTNRQQRVFDFIHEFIRAEGMPPTRAEIAKALGFRSVNAAEDHLKALVRKGAIEMIAGTSRGIRVKAEASEQGANTGIPVVGRVAAGDPILAEEHIEDRYHLDPKLFRPRADYLLRVKGLSMREAGIFDGDLLAVHRTPDATNGQIVVARVEDEVTVKRFRKRGNIVRLLPENDDFSPSGIQKPTQRQGSLPAHHSKLYMHLKDQRGWR
ncbi:MAG: transcriptional repressor LexA, partial [Gammaproteobacteria bacterium]|nr:transcriptional repressor LexA [Gammaproteobacteria bacterium]